MPYSGISFLNIRGELGQRLNDPNSVYWTDAEKKLLIQDALRFWNCLTADNKQNFPLKVSPSSVWYDLQTLSQAPASPRLSNLTDRDIYLRLTYQLLEAPSNTAILTTGQFQSDDLIQSVQRKRDEFIFRTGCTSTVETLGTSPNVATTPLPQTVIQVRRAYWIPASISGQPSTAFPLFRNDEFSTAAYGASSAISPGTPVGYSVGMEPPLTLEMTPPPDRPGSLECLAVESQGSLSASSPTALLIPSDFAPGLLWGALADLLSMGQQKQDMQRTLYARQRFEEYIELLAAYPFVFSARVNGLPVFVDAVETLDCYSPQWRTVSTSPQIVGTSGQNLVAYPSSQSAIISLSLCANANIPVADGDFIALGDEVIDCVLDEAASVGSYKLGGAEAMAGLSLHENIIKLAAKRREKIRAMSIFSNTLYGRADRENIFSPLEMDIK